MTIETELPAVKVKALEMEKGMMDPAIIRLIEASKAALARWDVIARSLPESPEIDDAEWKEFLALRSAADYADLLFGDGVSSGSLDGQAKGENSNDPVFSIAAGCRADRDRFREEDISLMRETLEWVEDYALSFADLEEVAKRAGMALRAAAATPAGSRCEELVKDKWQPIDTVRRNKSVIFQSWWAHQPSAPYVFEGYLDWDGVTWRYQDGNPLKSDITAPVYWQDLPTPASYRNASDDLKEAEGVRR